MITALTTALGLGVIAFVAYFTRMNKQARKFVHDSADAIAAIGRGDLAHAKAIFERWLTSNSPKVESAARHGLVIVLMRQGELEQALEVLTAARERDSLTPASVIVATDYASCYALLGALDSAQSWLAKATEQANDAEMISALIAFPSAVLSCRKGLPADASRSLDDKWAGYEAVLNGQSLRILRIVRAFAHAAAGSAADTMLAEASPAYAGEYAFLGKAWPEMATFLASHGLT
jgi:tetratricopeptide (TPR) repeat protein